MGSLETRVHPSGARSRIGAGPAVVPRLLAILRDVLLALWAIVWALPLLWSIAVAFRPEDVPIRSGDVWFAGRLTTASFGDAWGSAPFPIYFLNTIIIVVGILVVQLVTSTLAGYAFSRLRFPGRDVLFLICMVQLLVPTAALIVPNYATIRSLGLFDTRLAVMLPFFASAFGTFLIRQTFLTVPRELEDAARIDGCAWWQALWHVFVPSARPALVAFGMVSIAFHWNDFLWPLIVTNSPASRPLTVGLASFTEMGEQGARWSLVNAGTLLVVGPLLLLFLIFQRQFVNSFLRSGLK
jgi:sn-glycerol 3-phosphate transport system permease protein